MPGLGPRTAETVAAHLHHPGRFHTGKQVSAYGGLVPRQYQSGDTDHKGRITRRGPALLRKLLVECAWVMLRYNPWARAVYARLSQGKARKKQAIVALARKLLVRCWAMLRDGAPWRDPAPQAAPACVPPPLTKLAWHGMGCARPAEDQRPEGASRVSSQLCRSRVTARCHRRMSERRGGAAYPDAWAGTPSRPRRAAARIVECNPKALDRRG